MDQAIYYDDGITKKIFGVRGQWVFMFDPVTGNLQATLRFATSCTGVSSICTIGTFLYIGTTQTPSVNYSGSPVYVDQDIYVVNPTTFTLAGKLGLAAQVNPLVEAAYVGWRCLTPVGTSIAGYMESAAGGFRIFLVDPTNIAGFTQTTQSAVTDMVYDSVNGVLWMPDSSSPDIFCYDPNFASFNRCNDTNGNLNSISGICYNYATNKVFAVDGTFAYYSFNAGAAMPGFNNFHVNSFNSGRINSTAYRIKSVDFYPSNPLNGKVLMPCWADDTVLVIDPTSSAVVLVKTGFTSPIDIVSTPTKNWAVQSGNVGLKEIV